MKKGTLSTAEFVLTNYKDLQYYIKHYKNEMEDEVLSALVKPLIEGYSGIPSMPSDFTYKMACKQLRTESFLPIMKRWCRLCDKLYEKSKPHEKAIIDEYRNSNKLSISKVANDFGRDYWSTWWAKNKLLSRLSLMAEQDKLISIPRNVI